MPRKPEDPRPSRRYNPEADLAMDRLKSASAIVAPPGFAVVAPFSLAALFAEPGPGPSSLSFQVMTQHSAPGDHGIDSSIEHTMGVGGGGIREGEAPTEPLPSTGTPGGSPSRGTPVLRHFRLPQPHRHGYLLGRRGPARPAAARRSPRAGRARRRPAPSRRADRAARRNSSGRASADRRPGHPRPRKSIRHRPAVRARPARRRPRPRSPRRRPPRQRPARRPRPRPRSPRRPPPPRHHRPAAMAIPRSRTSGRNRAPTRRTGRAHRPASRSARCRLRR